MQKLPSKWQTPYMRTLNHAGKLVYIYAVTSNYCDEPIIPEDIATAVDVEMGVVEAWLEQFIQDGQIKAQLVQGIR